MHLSLVQLSDDVVHVLGLGFGIWGLDLDGMFPVEAVHGVFLRLSSQKA